MNEKKKKKRKVVITWEFHPDRKAVGYKCKHVYLYDAIGKASGGRWHIRGFDSSNSRRFVSFYDRKLAKEWAHKHGFKVVKKSKWRKKFNKLKKKHDKKRN